MPQKPRKVAIFDIDGTIFRSSLLIEITDGLIQEGVFPAKARKQYQNAYQAWLERKDSYDKYIDAVVEVFLRYLKGIRHKDFSAVVKKVVAFHQDRVYRYTRDLIRSLKQRGYFLLAISNSPKEILDEFCRRYGFDKVYGRLYEIGPNGAYTGEIIYLDMISDKAKILQRALEKENLTLKNSIGVGDTESDIAFLKLVDRPICFNPNLKLYQRAKKFGWEIVVERKDVVYIK
ncbi:MAG TPA: HAD-IB family hydrolase [Candidatus Paceibacterota bacterium]